MTRRVLVAVAMGLAVAVGVSVSIGWAGWDRLFFGGDETLFRLKIVDRHGPSEPWGKGIGDIDGDGRLDLVIGGNGGELVWYVAPEWRRHVIAKDAAFGTDVEVADLDGDGKADIVATTRFALVWYRQSGDGRWERRDIVKDRLHDIEVVDLDGDGRLDIVGRNQSAFRGSTGNLVHVYFNDGEAGWSHSTLPASEGEGLAVADLDLDGRLDVVLDGQWWRNPGAREASWVAFRFAADWSWPHVVVSIGDVDGDGRVDIAMAPAEPGGRRYRISWFRAPSDPFRIWDEVVVDADVESVQHALGIADIDLDGRPDLVAASMHQGAPPQEVRVYRQGPHGVWSKIVLARDGSHNLRLADIDADGDVDLLGANHSGEMQSIRLWMNQRCVPREPVGSGWRRHVVDERRPGPAAFVGVGDLDGDRLPDIVTGGVWYRNPGLGASRRWLRHAFGGELGDAAAIVDADGDGDLDVVGMGEIGSSRQSRVAWAENLGDRRFRVRNDAARAHGDFLQGAVVGRFTSDDRTQIALSWHRGGRGTYVLTVPRDPAANAWTLDRISELSQEEALSAGDIDRDGRVDLLLGTFWLRNAVDGFHAHRIAEERESPDRNRLVDIDRDGRLDAVVGFEAISRPGEIVWYRQPMDPLASWVRTRIGIATGPMSLDVGDVDGDGLPDVVVGEHDVSSPSTARLLLYLNPGKVDTPWPMRVLGVGDEHHDGAQLVDVDGDGDLDVVSIGWSHRRVLWYENPARGCR